MIRRQLTTYSPLSPRLIVKGAWTAARSPASALEAFSTDLAARYEADQVILTASGTQALQLALRASSEPPQYGDAPVALPAYTCFDVLTAAVGADVGVVFYDVDPRSLTPDPSSLRRALELGARRVVAGNLFGFPMDWDSLLAMCREFGALLIEDAAQGLGSTWQGRKGGCFGDLTVLSFSRGKGWTGGGGGALLMRSSESVDWPSDGGPLAPPLPTPGRGAAVRALAACAVQWTFGRPWLYGLPASTPGLGLGETRYKEPRSPTSMSATAAAVAHAHAGAAERAKEHRRHWAKVWRDLCTREEVVATGLRPCEPGERGTSAYLRFPLVAASSAQAERIASVARAAGVARGYPAVLPCLPQARPRTWNEAATPGALLLAQRLVTFPTHERLTRRDVDFGIRAARGPA